MNENFIGVFPIDQIPIVKLKKFQNFIFNTDPSYKQGKHWIAIFSSRDGYIEYFDTSGVKPSNQIIMDFFKKNGNKYLYSNIQIQSNRSDTCGVFCLIFLLFRMKDIPFNVFLSLFTKNKSYNELLIKKMFDKMNKI